jgi:SAM-dependent methyltransferase
MNNNPHLLDTLFSSFALRDQFDSWYDSIVGRTRVIEEWLSTQSEIDGFCDCCLGVVPLRVETGCTFGESPNLREGMVCPAGVSNRARLLYRAYKAAQAGPSVALFEHGTPLWRAISSQNCDVASSEFFAPELASGALVQRGGAAIRHEDLTNCSYGNEQFNCVIHNDVLEHVPDYRQALRESARILKPSGLLLFTAPFFVERNVTGVLASVTGTGEVIHHVQPPEWHGDHLREKILAYYHFGWSLLDDVHAAGFACARILIGFDPFSGLVSNNHPAIRGGNMPPLLVAATKATPTN